MKDILPRISAKMIRYIKTDALAGLFFDLEINVRMSSYPVVLVFSHL